MEIMPIASGSTGNAYRVSDGESALLLDAGIPIRAIQIALKGLNRHFHIAALVKRSPSAVSSYSDIEQETRLAIGRAGL